MSLKPTPHRADVFCRVCSVWHDNVPVRAVEPESHFGPVNALWFYCPTTGEPESVALIDWIVRNVYIHPENEE
jgi:hypothetical protein